MVGVPAVALVGGLALYLAGGRYITTDNAYIGARKVLFTPDVSGKIGAVIVREGQHVGAGDELFLIEQAPFEFALRETQGRIDAVRTQFATLKSNHNSLNRLVELGEQVVSVKRRVYDRKSGLAARHFSTQADLEDASATLLAAELQLQPVRQQLAETLNQLQGDPDLAIENFPPLSAGQSEARSGAARFRSHTCVATQVDNIQLGRFVTAGALNDSSKWVEANPKETEITHLRVGEKVATTVDTFPGHAFHGHVASVGPGTGAQFAILPPQNANGNWVKVVQRVPVRIEFEPGQRLSALRAGMSVTVAIHTKRQRSIAELVGTGESLAEEEAR